MEPLAQALFQNGIKGIFAFDVAVVPTRYSFEFPVIECNPRYNGASYPTLIAEKLGIEEWTALNLSTKYRDLASLDLSDLEYNHSTGEGLVIVNWGTVLEGKIAVLMAGTQAYQEALQVELLARL